MAAPPKAQGVRHRKEIPWYYPNIIGYTRVVLILIATTLFNVHPWRAALCYTISELLDSLDGHVARYFNQASLFGAMLDQLTDRMSTVSIFLLLATRYPTWVFTIFLICIVDMTGHWCYTNAQALRGTKNHKDVPTQWKMLRAYYSSRRN